MSHCASQYQAALSDPFSNLALGACLPRFPALRSQKLAILSKFLVSTNAEGNGFLHIIPTLANDSICAHFSTSSWTGDSNSVNISVATAGTETAQVNSPYSSAQLVAEGIGSCRGRILSVGARITPVTSVSNLGGLITMYVDPDHSDVNAISGSNTASRPTASTMRVGPKGTVVQIAGIREEEFEYTPNSGSSIDILYPFSSSEYSSVDTTVGNAVCKVAFYAGESTQTYWVELIEHCEFIGPLTAGSGTMSHVDPNGFAAVNAAAHATQSSVAGRSYDSSSYARVFAKNVRDILAEFTPDAATVGYVAGRGLRGTLAGLGPQRGALALTL